MIKRPGNTAREVFSGPAAYSAGVKLEGCSKSMITALSYYQRRELPRSLFPE